MANNAGTDEALRQPTPPVPVALARWLLAYEAGEKQSPEELAAAGEHVYHQLRVHLAVVLGTIGFDALWARALYVAQPKFRAEDDESFTTRASHAYGLYAAVRGHDVAMVQHNLVVAFASFFTLLFTFIGEELSLRFIRQLWPELSPDAVGSRADGARS